MKKEKRIVIKNDDKENTIKKAVHAANEGKMWARFKKRPGYLGIDCVTLDVTVKNIDELKLDQLTNDDDVTVIPKKCKVNTTPYNVYKHYTNIKIKIYKHGEQFGQLTIVSGLPNKYTTYSRLELYHAGVNFSTVNIKGLRRRFKEACTCLKRCGIELSTKRNTTFFYKLELAFTFATDLMLPLKSRMLFMNSIRKGNKICLKTAKGAVSTDGDFCYLSNVGNKNNLAVLYDKIAKAEGLNQIACRWRDIRIYRFEVTESKKKLEKSKFLLTSDIYAISDKMLEKHFINKLDEAIDYYCKKICPNSPLVLTNLYNTCLDEIKKENAKSVVGPLTNTMKDLLHNSSKPFVIDSESICYFTIAKKDSQQKFDNGPRTKHNLISSNSVKGRALSHMNGWETERLFAFIKACVLEQDNILTNYSKDGIHCFQVAYGEYTNRDDYLNGIISSHKVFVYSTEVRERINSKWYSTSFELNKFNDNIVLPYREWLFFNK